MKKKLFFTLDFSKYEGKYVAVIGRRVIARGTNAKRVWLEAKKKKNEGHLELHKIRKHDTILSTLAL